MKSITIRILPILVIMLLSTGIFAQDIHQSVAAGGGDIAGTTGSVSYTVGQLVYTPIFGSAGSVEQGVQEIFEIMDITEIGEHTLSYTVAVFPNPASEELIIKIDLKEFEGCMFRLYDISGELIHSNYIMTDETSVDMSGLMPSTYLLILSNHDQEYKTFKILKK